MVFTLAVCIFPAILVLIGIRKLRERSWGSCTNKVQLDNKVAIVTGANSGIGYEIAKELAARNAEVIFACRNVDLANKAIERIRRKLNNSKSKMVAMELDLASLQSVRKFAEEVQKSYAQIHLLINNAGVAYPKKKILYTKNAFEIHLGVNHIGHFYLTNLLLSNIRKSAPSRIVVVSSTLHQKGQLNPDNLNTTEIGPKTDFYANSKLANVYFCRELAKGLKNSGVNVYACCPGWVYTGLFRHSIAWYHYILVAPIAYFFMRTPRQGAQTVVYCATEPSLENVSGLLYRDCKPYESKVKFDEKTGQKLWEESQRMVNTKIA